ncbi:hypothetical protein POK33_39535, partial [Burkholderia cenocepacia]|nr:hypothetical protein [Burkholderia cenocepacia]
MTSFTRIESAAHDSAYGSNSLPSPTPAMQDAGNYKKGRVDVHGIPIVIENPRGSVREWRAADGTSGQNLMKFHYGYFQGVKGADGDELDCFIGPYPEADTAYVINQQLDGKFDEHKVMLGFPDKRMAEAGYRTNYDLGWNGLGSCIPCSIEQLRWWMAYGDKSKPLTPDQLPYEERNEMDKVLWDSAHEPRMTTIAKVLYDVRVHDAAAGLMFDPVTVADILEDADSVTVYDALVVPYNRLERRMDILRKVMDRAVPDLTVAGMQVTQPFTQKGTTNVAAVFELSDGQTLSIFFHNPDVTPKKILPNDDVISWKWLLNKKDVTIVVAPERGRDLNVRAVAQRVMKLAGRNSSRFTAANAKRAERMQNIESMKAGYAEKEQLLDALIAEIADLEKRVAAKPTAPASAPDPEAELRAMWTEQGVPEARQNELIAQIGAKAAPGAQVGPFVVPDTPSAAIAPAVEAAPEGSVIPSDVSSAEMVVLIATKGYRSPFRLQSAMHESEISEAQYADAIASLNAGGKYMKRSAITPDGRAVVDAYRPDLPFVDGKLRTFKGKFGEPSLTADPAPAADPVPAADP